MATIKAELWDKTQYIFTKYYDRMMHFSVYYEGKIDLLTMQKAIMHVIKFAPTMRAKYCVDPFRPHWKLTEDYTLEMLASKLECKDSEVESNSFEFLKGDISHKSDLQYRCLIVEGETKTNLCFLVNHMCFDGADFRYVVNKIAESYNAIMNTGSADAVEVKHGTRSLEQMYRKMPEADAKVAKGLYNNASKTGIKKKFAFTDDTDCEKHFTIRKMNQDLFAKVKVKGKENGATLNDVFLAAYFRAWVKEANIANTEPVNITSMMDLRKHMSDKTTDGITNMTAFMPCKLAEGVGETFLDTLKSVVAATDKTKSDPVCGLYGLPLLALAFKIFPYFISQMAIKIGYDNPLMGMSNIGILKAADLDLVGAKMYDCFVTGAVKYKPYFQLTAISFNNTVTFGVAQKCGLNDLKLIQSFMDDYMKELEEFAK